MIAMLYILDGHLPKPEPDLEKWSEWFQTADHRRVALDRIGTRLISTVFLGVDHNFARLSGDPGPPILFETMIFTDGSGYEDYQERYATWEQAQAGHAAAVAHVKSQLPVPQ